MTGDATDRSSATFDSFEATGWEGAARTYTDFFDPITDRLIGPILDATGTGRGARLLDLACGHGNLSAGAASRGAQPTGVDVAEAMLRRARQSHPALDFRRADAMALPFPAAVFDVAVANFAILHFSQPERAVSELARVLVPGGRVALTVWDHPERARLFGWVRDAIALVGTEPSELVPEGPPFFRFAVEKEIHELLIGNGFEAASVRTVTFTHSVPSVDAVWTGIVDGTVRTAALISNQPPDVQLAIREAFGDVVARESPGSSVNIPFSVKLATATKPRVLHTTRPT